MLTVVSLEEAKSIVRECFDLAGALACEHVSLEEAAGRVLAEDVVAQEGIPPFDRSMMDGFAVRAADTFGCSESLPAILDLAGEVLMGAAPECSCLPGSCVRIPTGGQIPEGADAVVMLEYCEEYGDGTIGVTKPVAPAANIAFENDDVAPGQVIMRAGTRLRPHHVGTLASMGCCDVNVRARPRVGVISTGDEIVPVSATPKAAQMRDVNAPMLAAAARALGAVATCYPIVPDDYDTLLAEVSKALGENDILLVSGGSSAGARDNTAAVLSQLGKLLFHGIAMKPGKPTICADVQGKPAFGLPGHPVAANFAFLELVAPLIEADCGAFSMRAVRAVAAETIPSNHGRAELVAVRLEQGSDCVDGESLAVPIRSKSGLISRLCEADGYIVIPRNLEGVAAGSPVEVKPFVL